MRSTTKLIQDTLKNGPAQRYSLLSAPALEGYAQGLIDEARSFTGKTLTLESQQMVRSKELAELTDLKEELTDFLPQEIATGHVHHYLIDVAGVAAGDAGAQATLKALVTAAIKTPEQIVVAALPASGPVTAETDATAIALANSMEHYGVKMTFTNREHYVSFLSRL